MVSIKMVPIYEKTFLFVGKHIPISVEFKKPRKFPSLTLIAGNGVNYLSIKSIFVF